MKILFGDFNAKLGKDNWDESLQQDSNDNVVRIVKFATSRNLLRAQCFPAQKHTYIWTSSDGKTPTTRLITCC
jgi:hypothetical protein